MFKILILWVLLDVFISTRIELNVWVEVRECKVMPKKIDYSKLRTMVTTRIFQPNPARQRHRTKINKTRKRINKWEIHIIASLNYVDSA